MKRSFSVVANSGHLHMYLWGELHGGIRALGLSLCQSEDFIFTKASDDIAGVDLGGITLRVSIALGVGIALGAAITVDLGPIHLRVRIAISIASGVGIASGVEVAAAIRVGIAVAISITAAAGFTAALRLASNLGKLLVA